MRMMRPSRLDCRGAFGQSSPNVGRGMRWTRACHKTSETGADGKIVQARRPSGRCQVSRVNNPRGDGDNKARSLRGEHEISCKPLRRECRCFG
jgi:hypothetical protein